MKDFIPSKEALELKQLGFDEPCFRFQNNISHTIEEKGWLNWNEVEQFVSLPLFSQAFRFFREKYDMLANVYSNASGFLFEWHDTTGGTHRYDAGFDGPNDSGCWDTYEDAEIACLRELIKIAKTKKP